jgi:hypothetical protein
MIKLLQDFLDTSGTGYWSYKTKSVKVTHIEVPYVNDEGDFGELCVYFDTTSWDVNKDGLIYTDKLFLAELKKVLTEQGFDASGISYSEQGMQGDNYVSLDVDQNFLDTFLPVQALAQG